MVEIKGYQYGAAYVPNIAEFWQQVRDKTIVPHQVELQPASPGGAICWLRCPHCYGTAAEDTGERMSTGRWCDLVHELADGGVTKVLFAGYATDPLNNFNIARLVRIAIDRNMVFGINTKALRIDDELLHQLSRPDVQPTSWITVSVDAGSNAIYNLVHGIKSLTASAYDRVRENVAKLIATEVEVAATYLVNEHNDTNDEVGRFLIDFRNCAIRRFAFFQQPRGRTGFQPTPEQRVEWSHWLKHMGYQFESPGHRVLFVDPAEAIDRHRTLPCVARWVFPTVGFDGWLYPCSQTGAPTFRSLTLGSVAHDSFWRLYYAYDADNIGNMMLKAGQAMENVGCRCDRKAHLVNNLVGEPPCEQP